MSQAPAVPAPHDPYAPLRIPNFRWFVGSILAMAMGAQVQGLVVAWQVFPAMARPIFSMLLLMVHPNASYGPG